MTLPTDRDDVRRYCEANLPGWDLLDLTAQMWTIDYLIALAVDLNERTDLWDKLPHDVWDHDPL